jgi:glycosyltransferase involved in cell wall biosynthesis
MSESCIEPFFAPCIVVPVYRHAAKFAVFSELLPKNIPMVVVDDGNSEEESRILQNLGYPTIRFPRNQGKGRAMMAGLRKAADEGYTHALQIDADGQHDINDIPKYLSTAKDNPRALINGCPIYDADAPRARVYGRKITNFWVRLETGCENIRDAMCGFRVYPLGAMKPLLDDGLFFNRMGGDIEILVRAYWLGIEIITLDTKVTYHEDGFSNFSMLRDNIRFFGLHTMLVCTMLARKVLG